MLHIRASAPSARSAFYVIGTLQSNFLLHKKGYPYTGYPHESSIEIISFFSHPDYTVGIGIAPIQPFYTARGL